jgi:hypothetical protein
VYYGLNPAAIAITKIAKAPNVFMTLRIISHRPYGLYFAPAASASMASVAAV